MINKVKEIREEQGLTQEQLSENSGVSRTTISELENNKTGVITNITLEKIAKALNRNVTDVFYTN